MAVTLRDGAVMLGAQGDDYPDWAFVKNILWENPTDAGHLMELTDTQDKAIMKLICKTTNQDIHIPGPGWCRGLKLPDLDSGIVKCFDH